MKIVACFPIILRVDHASFAVASGDAVVPIRQLPYFLAAGKNTYGRDLRTIGVFVGHGSILCGLVYWSATAVQGPENCFLVAVDLCRALEAERKTVSTGKSRLVAAIVPAGGSQDKSAGGSTSTWGLK